MMVATWMGEGVAIIVVAVHDVEYHDIEWNCSLEGALATLIHNEFRDRTGPLLVVDLAISYIRMWWVRLAAPGELRPLSHGGDQKCVVWRVLILSRLSRA